jgi:hypothetical protein
MATLKAIRFLVGLVWVGIFFWGVVSLFQGQWLALVIAVVLWIIVAFVFMSLHNSLQRLEISHVSELAQAIGFQTAVGDWAGALSHSQRTVQILGSSSRRDNSANMAGPLALAMLNHGLLLGANGRVAEAMSAIERAAPALRTAAGANPHFGVAADVAVDVVDALADEGPSPDPAVFKQLALALNQ